MTKKSKKKKSKKRVFASGDLQQHIFHFSGHGIHHGSSNIDLMIETEDAKLAIFEAKQRRTSADHIFPRALFIDACRTPDEDASLTIPELVLKLVPFIVSRKLRDGVMGDLQEDFRAFAARFGRRYASWLLCWELAELCIRRFGPTAIVMTVGAWVRQKFGW